MLVAQAKRASELFQGTKISDETMRSVLESIAFEMRNVILIGMPSGGKSTIGALLSKKLHRTFVDIDNHIPAAAGKSIPEIFSDDG